jgi:hypothetical protein
MEGFDIFKFRQIARLGSRFALALLLLPYLVGCVAYWLIVIADPYDLRVGGWPMKLATHRYPDREWPLLMDVVAAQRHDLVLIGGSTTMAITPAMLRTAFPGTKSPINLSYIAPRPLDLGDALTKISRIKGLRRAIVVMDFTLMEKRPYRSATGDTLQNMKTTSWHHGGDFSPHSAMASFNLIVRGTYTISGWEKIAQPEFMDGAVSTTHSPGNLRRYREAVSRHRNDVFAKTSINCSDIPFINNQLTGFLKEVQAKGFAVDLAFPPLPYLLHYDWIENRPRFGILEEGPIFDQFMTFKKCVVAAVDKEAFDGVRVIALDSNDAISGSLGRYMDSAHIIESTAYLEVAKMLNDGVQTLTTSNIDQYEIGLKSKISKAATTRIK